MDVAKRRFFQNDLHLICSILFLWLRRFLPLTSEPAVSGERCDLAMKDTQPHKNFRYSICLLSDDIGFKFSDIPRCLVSHDFGDNLVSVPNQVGSKFA